MPEFFRGIPSRRPSKDRSLPQSSRSIAKSRWESCLPAGPTACVTCFDRVFLVAFDRLAKAAGGGADWDTAKNIDELRAEVEEALTRVKKPKVLEVRLDSSRNRHEELDDEPKENETSRGKYERVGQNQFKNTP